MGNLRTDAEKDKEKDKDKDAEGMGAFLKFLFLFRDFIFLYLDTFDAMCSCLRGYRWWVSYDMLLTPETVIVTL